MLTIATILSTATVLTYAGIVLFYPSRAHLEGHS